MIHPTIGVHSSPFSLILRIVSNFEQSRHRRRYRVTKRNGLVYKPVVYLPKESFFNLMSRMEGE